MNAVTETEATFEIEAYFADEMSGYGLIKAVNKILADLGIDKELPGPMGYTYLKKGYIKPLADNNKRCTKAAAIEWTEKYLAKLVAKTNTETEEVVVPNDEA
jgi:hypothetical protein